MYKKDYSPFDHSEVYGELQSRNLIKVTDTAWHYFFLILYTTLVTGLILLVIYHAVFPRNSLAAVHDPIMMAAKQHYWQVKFNYDLTHQMSTTTFH